eukprot:6491747-Amphidinium_carterae.1
MFLLARAYGVAVMSFDALTGDTLMAHGDPRARRHIAWANGHFFVTSRKCKAGRFFGAAQMSSCRSRLLAKNNSNSSPQAKVLGQVGVVSQPSSTSTCSLGDPIAANTDFKFNSVHRCTTGGELARHNHVGPPLHTCLVDGSPQRWSNRRQMAILEERHHDAIEEGVDRQYRPWPFDWLRLEDQWSRAWLLHDVARLVRWAYRALPHMQGWLQFNRTPPRAVHGGSLGGSPSRYNNCSPTGAYVYQSRLLTNAIIALGVFVVLNVFVACSCASRDSLACAGDNHGQALVLKVFLTLNVFVGFNVFVVCIVFVALVVYLTADVFIDSAVVASVVHGGAKNKRSLPDTGAAASDAVEPRRRYPFAGMSSVEINQLADTAAQSTQQRRRQAKAVLIAHGSFNPPHYGHIHMMQKARARLLAEGIVVQAGLLAIANKSWIWSKGAPALDDDIRVELINLMATSAGCGDWLRGERRGVDHNSHWQMISMLSGDYPGATIYGVWGSDYCNSSFPEGPGICVFRHGHPSPTENPNSLQFAVDEGESHTYSSTKLRKAIAARNFVAVAAMMSPDIVNSVKALNSTCWLHKEDHDGSTSAPKAASTIPMDTQLNSASAQSSNTGATSKATAVAPRQVVVEVAKSKPMPRRTHLQPRHAAVTINRPPLPRRRRSAPRNVRGIEEGSGVALTSAAMAVAAPTPPAMPATEAQPAAAPAASSVFEFNTEPFDGLQDAVDLVVEPALVMFQRSLDQMHLQENGRLAVHMGPPEKAALTVFPTREQRGAQSLPLHKLSDQAQWITLEGHLMSWHFVQLEVGLVRQAFRDLLSRTMSLVRSQAVLSFPGVTVVGAEHHFHPFTVFAKATSAASHENIAWEIQWLANSVIAAERRDYHMHSIRVCMHGAEWPSEPEVDSEHELFQLAHGGSFYCGDNDMLVTCRARLPKSVTLPINHALTALICIDFVVAVWLMLAYSISSLFVDTGAVFPSSLDSRHLQPCGERNTREPKTLRARSTTCCCFAHVYDSRFVLVQLACRLFLPCEVPLCVAGGSGHLQAFHCALYSRDQSCISPQGLVSLLESLVALKAVGTHDCCPPLLTCLAQSDGHLGKWGIGDSPGSLLRRDFIRGSFLDLTILAEHFQVGITVIDSEGVLRLHVRREAMIGLQINSVSLEFKVLGFALAYNQLCPIIKEDIHCPNGAQPLVWCASTQISVANMLIDNPPIGAPSARSCVIPEPLPRTDAVSSTLPWSSETSDPPTEFIAASLITLLHGGGRKGR